jgi:uncharacterized membrane protein YfcA
MSFLIGILAGAYGGLLGVGGGAVMIPMMVAFCKVRQHTAHGTSLAAMVFIGIAGAATYTLNGSIDVVASVLLAIPAIITVYAGVRYSNALKEWQLKRFFGVFLLIVSGLLFLKPFLPNFSFFAEGWSKVTALLVSGALTGFLSGMMGVGGAIVMIPTMVLIVGLDQHTAQGSSLLTMVPVGIVGAWTHMRLGNVQTRLLWGLIPGVFIGSYLGGSIAHLLQEGVLRTVFGLMMVWIAFHYLKTPVSEGTK